MKILITGATGFLGSHISERFIQDNNHELLLTKRTHSDMCRTESFINKVQWIDTEDDSWVEKAILFKPDLIIHSAWAGVKSSERNDWNVQLSNIDFCFELFEIARQAKTNKIICLGSQAEYGKFNGCISEDFEANPTTKYGIIKLFLLQQLKKFATYNQIDWYWLRVFSVFGKYESTDWLISSTINNILSGVKTMNFTKGEQKYAYLFVEDLKNAIATIVDKGGASGVYNLSSNQTYPISEILEFIKDNIDPNFQLKLGCLPYSEDQSMHIEGNCSKFIREFGNFEQHDFYFELKALIEYYKKKKNESI